MSSYQGSNRSTDVLKLFCNIICRPCMGQSMWICAKYIGPLHYDSFSFSWLKLYKMRNQWCLLFSS